MVNLATIGGGSAAIGAGVLGGLLGYWFEDTLLSTNRNRKITAVLIGATSTIGTLYFLQDQGLIDLLGKKAT